MAETIYALGLKTPVCSLCGERDCVHLDPAPTCKHCGQRKKHHADKTRKCPFASTNYEPLVLTTSLLGIEPSFVNEPADRTYKHKTRGGKGLIARLRGKK